MIDPTKITDYTLSVPELEERILFWVCAAGKSGKTAARGLDNFLNKIMLDGMSPFEAIRSNTQGPFHVAFLLNTSGIGCYTIKTRTFLELAKSGLDLRTCSTEDLEVIYGIGMKTSRCFIIHSRKDAKYAGLDTHILKYLRAQGIDAPKSTPTSKRQYLDLEKKFLQLATKSGKTVAEFDLDIWNYYREKNENGRTSNS